MPVDIAKLVEQTKNSRLQNQVGAQAAKVTAQGGKVKKGGPSIISRIFDVAQRPLYGIAEGVARASEHMGTVKGPRKDQNYKNPILDILEGMGKGVAGVTKTHTGDALLRAAEDHPGSLLSKPIRENRYNMRTGFGLVGDIGGDPITYSHIVKIAAGGKAAASKAGLKAVDDVMRTEKSVKAIANAAETAKAAKAASIAERTAAGAKVTKNPAKVIEKVGKSAGKLEETKIFNEAAKTVGAAAEAAAKTNAPGKVQLKIMGTKIAESEKLYKGIANLGKIAGDTKVGKNLNEAFRTAAKFPEKTLRMKRETELAGIAHAQADIAKMMHGAKAVPGAVDDFKGFSALKEHELELVTHAAEAGPVKNITVGKDGISKEEIVKGSSLHGQLAENGDDLGKYVEEMRKIPDDLFELEYDAGVFRYEKGPKKGQIKTREEAYRENYVPHYYKNAVDEAEAIKKIKAIGPDKPGFTMPRKMETLKDALKYNLDPHLRADTILSKRISASHHAIGRAKYADAVAKEYGQELTSATAKKLALKAGYKGVDSPYIPKNMVFPPQIADTFAVLEKARTDDKLYKSILTGFDKAQSELKFWQTAANPGHHARNAFGDFMQNFSLGGVVNPFRYEQSRKMLMSPETFKMSLGKGYIDGIRLKKLWIEKGAKPGYTAGEFAGADTFKGLGIKRVIAKASEKREEYFRMANFIEQMKKFGKDLDPKSPNFLDDLDKVASDAANEVRRINIDYGDVTDFERNVMKRVVPFYTWSRKNLPLQLEALAMHPGRVSVTPKATTAIETLLGTRDTGESGDPFATLPKYLKEMATVRLRGEGEGKNGIYWVPSLPFQDISKYTEGGQQGIMKSIMSDITPAIRVPFEMATGRQIFSGAPTPGNVDLAAGQVPLARLLNNIRQGKQKPASLKTLNWATGAGVHEITPAMKAGELRRQQDSLQSSIRSIRDKAKKKAMGG